LLPDLWDGRWQASIDEGLNDRRHSALESDLLLVLMALAVLFFFPVSQETTGGGLTLQE
jgi:hypothetical protein